ncbi:MAG TPA: hypothetical protein VIL33_00590 [Rhodothermia bacterium]
METGYVVRPVESSADLTRFIAFPYDLYQDAEHWVPPLRVDQAAILNPKKSAFLEHGRIQPFLATDAMGAVVGRIAGIVNGMHLKKYQDGTGFFGFFECIEEYEVAHALFETVSEWLRGEGLKAARGPANPSLNHVSGLLVDGFDRPPAILMPYNFPYYSGFLERFGFERIMTMWAYYIHFKYRKLERMRKGVELIKKRNPDLELRTIDMGRFDEEAQMILDIYNDAWSDNWGHVPMTQGEFAELVKEMKMIVDPRTIFVLEKAGVPVAFSIMLPDVNPWFREVRDGKLFPLGLLRILKHKMMTPITEGRVVMMGVLQEYQGRGFDAILNLASLEIPVPYGYNAAEMSWILDSNKPMMNAAEAIGGVRDKEYAMYELALDSLE